MQLKTEGHKEPGSVRLSFFSNYQIISYIIEVMTYDAVSVEFRTRVVRILYS